MISKELCKNKCTIYSCTVPKALNDHIAKTADVYNFL